MKTRVYEVPAYKIVTISIEAERFNLVRLALRRLGGPLRIQLEGLRHLELMLDTDLWVCVDSSLEDLPVLAWTDFESRSRGLHEPVNCKLRYYHASADVLMDLLWTAAEKELSSRLAK